MTLRLLVLLDCAAVAGTPDVDATPSWAEVLDPATRQIAESAAAAEARQDWRRAAAGWRLLLGRDPSIAPAGVGLGRALLAQGDREGAIKAWSRFPADVDAVLALGGLYEPDDPARAAQLYRRLQTLQVGSPDPWRLEARALAGVDASTAVESLAMYLKTLEIDCAAAGGAACEPDGVVIVTVAVGLEESGEEERAVAVLEEYLARWPEGAVAVEARGRLDRWAVERQAREMAVGGAEALDSALRERVERARARAAGGDPDGALVELREVVRAAPRSDEAWAALGDVHARLSAVVDAERAYALAVALAPDESAWRGRLGLLLAERYGGRRHREAIEELGRALALRPGWAELRYRLARVHQENGDWQGAARELGAYLEAEPYGAFSEDAQSRLEDLRRPIPEPPHVASDEGTPARVVPDAWDHYRVARVYADRRDVAAARVELALASELAPDWPATQNLAATLDLMEGDSDAAVRRWTQSLQVEPDQPQVRLALGDLHRRAGRTDEARALLATAASQGVSDAHYLLAAMAYEEGLLGLPESDRQLDAYFAASSGGIGYEPALALRRRVDQRYFTVRSAVGGVLAVLVSLVGALSWRRYGARPLAALLRRAPESAHDAARILSAIRHEVVKHNTALLGEMAGALDHGDLHAVRWAASRLFGEGATPDPASAVDRRFFAYLDELERLGRRHGVRLDLRRADPVLGPMSRAMRRLRALEARLRNPPSRSGRTAIAARLRELSAALNERGYREVGRLIREMGTVRMSESMLRSVDARVRAEAAFAGESLPALAVEVPGSGFLVRAFQGDVEDVAANLLRNAYGALVRGVAPAERRVGVALAEDDDPVTGLALVQVRVRDNAPEPLTDAMIRGREIGRGLGLTLDLVARHEGSLTVEADPGWSKAVVVRLPRAEAAGDSTVGAA